MFRLLAFILALALLPASVLASPRAVAVGSFPAADGSEIAVVGSSARSAESFMSTKRCSRGAMMQGICSADIGLPVTVFVATANTIRVAYEKASSTMAGVSPGCLVGPPRSC